MRTGSSPTTAIATNSLDKEERAVKNVSPSSARSPLMARMLERITLAAAALLASRSPASNPCQNPFFRTVSGAAVTPKPFSIDSVEPSISARSKMVVNALICATSKGWVAIFAESTKPSSSRFVSESVPPTATSRCPFRACGSLATSKKKYPASLEVVCASPSSRVPSASRSKKTVAPATGPSTTLPSRAFRTSITILIESVKLPSETVTVSS